MHSATGVCFAGVESEADVENFFSQQESLIALGAVVFDEESFDGGDQVRRDATIKYKIRLRAEQRSGTETGSAGDWLTSHMFPTTLSVGPRGDKYGGLVPGETERYLQYYFCNCFPIFYRF